MEIEKMLVLSTAHVSESTADLINRIKGLSWGPAFESTYGWIFHVSPLAESGETDDPPGTPPEIRAALHLARLHRCKWLLFDSDGPVVEELQTYEW